jgi:hypothetical protein
MYTNINLGLNPKGTLYCFYGNLSSAASCKLAATKETIAGKYLDEDKMWEREGV